ncbi:MAG: tetratricopeptide repeat protein [Planctomycetales bacterium]|nr:tetratricopeptide repeat protein [Planctomycetales bacterium]MBN8624193.1 tetratricopeptide repeat protein [Planctomycetota bacterium]
MTFRFLKPSRYATFLLCGTYAGCAVAPTETDWLGRPAGPAGVTAKKPNLTASPPRETSSAEAARHLATAREMEAHGNAAAAVEQYEQALRFDAEAHGVQARLAVLYEQLGMLDRAGAAYEAALAENNGDAELWNDYAGYQLHTGRPDDAEQSARRALALDGEHRRARAGLALALAEQEKYDESLTEFSKAVPPATAHHNLAVVLARQGKADEARHHLAEAQRLDPTLRPPPEALKQLSEEYVRASQVDATPKRSRRTRAEPAGD